MTTSLQHTERIDPQNVPPGILAIHRIRYSFAAPYCANRVVLDVASGVGYGSDSLALNAHSVLGVDIDPMAIRYAITHYARGNVHFCVGDATAICVASESVGTVLSFETIEHLPDIPGYLREVMRVLEPGGTFIVSTPQVRKTNPHPANPFHRIEFSAADFQALLKQHFAGVELFGQSRVQNEIHSWLQRLDFLRLRRVVPTRFRYAIDRGLGTTPFEEMSERDQQITRGVDRKTDVLVAVCTKTG